MCCLSLWLIIMFAFFLFVSSCSYCAHGYCCFCQLFRLTVSPVHLFPEFLFIFLSVSRQHCPSTRQPPAMHHQRNRRNELEESKANSLAGEQQECKTGLRDDSRRRWSCPWGWLWTLCSPVADPAVWPRGVDSPCKHVWLERSKDVCQHVPFQRRLSKLPNFFTPGEALNAGSAMCASRASLQATTQRKPTLVGLGRFSLSSASIVCTMRVSLCVERWVAVYMGSPSSQR